MVGCFVKTCITYSENSSDSWHRFPQNPERRSLWLENVGRSDRQPLESSKICGKHFKGSDYNVRETGPRLLKKTAIPTLHHQRTIETRYYTEEDVLKRVVNTSPEDHQYAELINFVPEVNEHQYTAFSSTQEREVNEANDVNQQAKITKLTNQVKQLNRELNKLKRKHNNIENIFNADQLSVLSAKKRRVDKWSAQTTQKAMTLKFTCGYTGYEEILKQGIPLPSQRTLRRRLHQINFKPGILSSVISYMKLKVDSMDSKERKCAITIDEMSIKSAIQYDQSSGAMMGSVTLPQHSGYSTHALVFMASGISSRWKQTVAYYYTGNSTNGEVLNPILKDIIAKLENIGLQVIAVTTDMGSVNRAMWRTFGISSTKHGGIKNFVQHPVDQTRRLYFLADVPHLLKNLKSALISNDIVLSQATVQQFGLLSNIVSKKPIESLLKYQEGKHLKLAPKITKEMLEKAHFASMKVGNATHIMSKEVGSALRFMVSDKALSLSESEKNMFNTTAWFLETVNHWFDLMSSRCPVNALSKYRMEHYTEACNFLRSFMAIVTSMRVGAQCSSWKPIQTGITLSTTSVLNVGSELLDNHRFLLTSRFSQDCLENVFSSVRAKNPTPTAKEFGIALKAVTVSQYMRDPRSGNYDLDDNTYLADFLNTNPEKSHDVENSEQLLICNLTEKSVFSDDQTATLYYIGGYCLQNLLKNKQICKVCFTAACTSAPEYAEHMHLTRLKEFKKDALCFITSNVFDDICAWEKAFQLCCTYSLECSSIRDQIKANCKTSSNIVNCHDLMTKLLNKFLNVRLHHYAKQLTTKKQEENKNKNQRNLGSKSMAMRCYIF